MSAAVTGRGTVTSLGEGADAFFDALTACRSGIQDGASACLDFDPETYMDPREARKADRFTQLGLAAALQAAQESGLEDCDPERVAVVLGTGVGGLTTLQEQCISWLENGDRGVSPNFVPMMMPNAAAAAVAMRLGLRGAGFSVASACATGAHALGDAARLIQWEDADVMVAGGAEAAICPIGIAGFGQARALSTGFRDDPTKGSRPYDRDRDGFVMGEGAGVVCLEEYEHAKKRGAKIYAEVVGYGLSGDAYHVTAPHPEGLGAYRSMEMAIRKSGLSLADIDYINAHGTSTPLGDELELNAVRKLFGSDLDGTSMSSTKSAIGHLLGGAGAVESIFCILALRDQVVPPTLNLENPSDNCMGVDLVPLKAKERKVKAVLNNSFGFGGTNASLVMKAI